jgi:hypothetical protein
MENVDRIIQSFKHYNETIEQHTKLNKRDASNQKLSHNGVLNHDTLVNNLIDYSKENVDSIPKQSKKRKERRLLRKKVLKNLLKPTYRLRQKFGYIDNKGSYIKTLQQLVPARNISAIQIPWKQKFGTFFDDQGMGDNFENTLLSYTAPLADKYIKYKNMKIYPTSDDIPIRYNVSKFTNAKTYIDPLKEKSKPKRFFGGFLTGAVTTLEAAIKVNIPIPFCQFPRSPCKNIY